MQATDTLAEGVREFKEAFDMGLAEDEAKALRRMETIGKMLATAPMMSVPILKQEYAKAEKEYTLIVDQRAELRKVREKEENQLQEAREKERDQEREKEIASFDRQRDEEIERLRGERDKELEKLRQRHEQEPVEPKKDDGGKGPTQEPSGGMKKGNIPPPPRPPKTGEEMKASPRKPEAQKPKEEKRAPKFTRVLDPNEDPVVYTDKSIDALRPFITVKGGDTEGLMANLEFMVTQPVHPETSKRAGEWLEGVRQKDLKPDPESLAKLKQWRMLGSQTMTDNTQQNQARENWEVADKLVTEKALDPDFKPTKENLLDLMNQVNGALVEKTMTKDDETGELVPAKAGFRYAEQASADGGMDAGHYDAEGHWDPDPTRMYLPGTDVEKAMDSFCGRLAAALEDEKANPIEVAARAYQEVVSIHPFHDANGRSARFIMDFVLQKKGLLPAALGEDVNLGCFPRIDPDQQPSPTGAVNTIMKGIQRSYEKAASDKPPLGPLPKLSAKAEELVSELTTHKALLESYDFPVDQVLGAYDKVLGLTKERGEKWTKEDNGEAGGLLGDLKNVIGGLPVLRKQMKPLVEAAGGEVAKLNQKLLETNLATKAPKDARALVGADPAELAALFECEVGKVTPLVDGLNKCLAVKPVDKLEDVKVEIRADFEGWSQLLTTAIADELKTACGNVQKLLGGFSPAVKKYLGQVIKPFEDELKRRNELVDSEEAKSLHQRLVQEARERGELKEEEKAPMSEEEEQLRKQFAALEKHIQTSQEKLGMVAMKQLDVFLAKYKESIGKDNSKAAEQVNAIKLLLKKKGAELPDEQESVQELKPEELKAEALNMVAKNATTSSEAKKIMDEKKQSAINGALGGLIDKSPDLGTFLAGLAQTGTKVEFSTSNDDPSMDKALYNETSNLIKIDANLDENVVVDMLLWEACNAQNQKEFKNLATTWNTKSPAEFGQRKAEVEADTSIKYAVWLNKLMEEGALSEEKGNITQNQRDQVETLKAFDKDFFKRPAEEQAEKAKEYIEFFKTTPQMKEAPRGSYTSLTSVEISVYDNIKRQGPKGIMTPLNNIFKKAGVELSNRYEPVVQFLEHAKQVWPEDPAERPKVYADLLKKQAAVLKELQRQLTEQGTGVVLNAVDIPGGYDFTDNMKLVATVQLIVHRLEGQFLKTKPEGMEAEEWEKQCEAKKKEWTKQLGAIENPDTLERLIEAAGKSGTEEEFFSQVK